MIPIRRYSKLIFITFIVSVGSMFQFAYLGTYINSAEEHFTQLVNESHFKSYNVYIDNDSFAWIWSIIVNCYQLGFLIGTLMTPILVEKMGRKFPLIMTAAFDIAGTALQIPSPIYKISYLLGIGRFVVGVGSGLSSGAVTLYLQEVSPTEVRGLVSSFQELSISLITLLGLVLGLSSVLGTSEGLPYLIAIGFVPALGKLILLKCPETPKYLLLKKGNHEMAKASLRFYHGANQTNVVKTFEEIKMEGELESSEENSMSNISRLFREPYLRKAIIIGVVCFVAQECTGMIPLVEFSTKILEQLHVKENVTATAAVLIGVFNVITTTIAIFLVEYFGRKKLLLSGLASIVAFQIILMICYLVQVDLASTWPGYLATACVIGITSVFGFGPGTIPWFITSELVPQSIRSTASTVTQVVNVIIMLAVNFAFLPAFYSLGGYSFLILLIVPTFLCIIYLGFALPETKNREISDIVLDLKKSVSKNTKELVQFKSAI